MPAVGATLPKSSATKLAKACARTPIGSQWGYYTVTSQAFAVNRLMYVRVRCKCGTVRDEKVSRLALGHARRCRACFNVEQCIPRPERRGAGHPAWKGDDHPREPFAYRKRLIEQQGGICAWPPCGKPLSGRVAVDHRHDRCCPDDKTCWGCVRGAVHQRCNMVEIEAAERAIALGGVMPDYIEAYLFKTTSNQESS